MVKAITQQIQTHEILRELFNKHPHNIILQGTENIARTL